MNLRRWALLGILFPALLLLARTAPAQTPGFGGVAWGTPAGELESFLKLKRIGAVDYYVNLNERYEIPGFPKPVVFYGFLDGKLYAAYVRLDSAAAYASMKKDLTAKYGAPKVKQESDTVINRWQEGEVKIKLKADMKNAVMKLAYYYEPAGKDRNVLSEELDAGSFKDLMKEWERESIKLK